jgi:hypothetical protein
MKLFIRLWLLSIVVNYVIAFVLLGFGELVADIKVFRVGFLPLFTAVSTYLVLFSDVLLFAYATRLYVVGKDVSFSDAPKLLRLTALASTPFAIFLLPDLVAGLGGVIAEDIFYGATAFTVFVWNAIVSVYTAFIHPIYAPLVGYAVANTLDTSDNLYKFIRKEKLFALHAIWISFVVWLATTTLANIVSALVSLLKLPIIPLPQASPLQAWRYHWVKTVESLMPRIYSLLVDPLVYTLYAKIVKSMLWLFR